MIGRNESHASSSIIKMRLLLTFDIISLLARAIFVFLTSCLSRERLFAHLKPVSVQIYIYRKVLTHTCSPTGILPRIFFILNKASPPDSNLPRLFHTEFSLKFLLSISFCNDWFLIIIFIFNLMLDNQTLSDVYPLKIWCEFIVRILRIL